MMKAWKGEGRLKMRLLSRTRVLLTEESPTGHHDRHGHTPLGRYPATQTITDVLKGIGGNESLVSAADVSFC